MSDKDYVELNPEKMGFRFAGMVAPPQQALLRETLAALRKDMGSRWEEQIAEREIFWINIWQDDEDAEAMELSDPQLAGRLEQWCQDTVRKYCEPGGIIDGYGFVINPAGTKKHQVWHVDYTTDSAAVWIPMTPFTEKNATQFITLPADTPKHALEQVAINALTVDVDALAGAVDHFVIQQITAKPMSILTMGRGTIHRGIPNAGNDDRIAFYISLHYIKDYDANYPYTDASMEEGGIANFPQPQT
jgi:hypothetical protein